MPRAPRLAPAGQVFHVLNRAVGRATIFKHAGDFEAFERVLAGTLEHTPMRICAYCVMPNHWHLLLWPRASAHLSAFMQRLTLTHVRRWQEYHGRGGSGHLYQGRYKSFPVQTDEHYLTVCRYVERNALRAGLVRRAELWQWSSLWLRKHGDEDAKAMLSRWPVVVPDNWVATVNRAQSQQEVDAMRTCISRSRPFGSRAWQTRTAGRLGLQSSLRPAGRPRKATSRRVRT